MFKRLIKNEKGLTLIELLAVVVILGIISAIAVPSIGGIINKTKDDAKIAEGIQIINAAKFYISANIPATDSVELGDTELAPYLDNVKDEGKDYTVTVTKDENGKYIYTLADHDANTVLGKDSLSELDLQNKTKGSSTDDTEDETE
jgi:type IV pilus assembly protein PilA